MAIGLEPIRTGLRIGALCLVLLPGNGWCALSYYLDLPGVPGTSQSVGHSNWTDVVSFHFGVNHLPGNRGSAFADLALDKHVDTISPLLAQQCASGGYFPSVKLYVIKDITLQAYQVKLDNVWVTSLAATIDTASENLNESLKLRFGKLTWTYTQFDASGLNSTNAISAYDLLYGKVPVRLTASGVQNPGSGTMDVTWNARAGATYNLLGSSQVDGTYTLFSTVTGTNLGPMTVTLPVAGGMSFYRIHESP